jgi:hypothetical protein
MTQSGHQLGQNDALQRAPDLMLANPLSCRLELVGAGRLSCLVTVNT